MTGKVGAVYMLANRYDTVLYTGFTADLIRRVYEHREELDPTSFTSRYRVFKLVHFELIGDLNEAARREHQIKGWSRIKKNRLVEASNRQWIDLWPQLVGEDIPRP
jgi:putative endonuclease